MCFQISYLDSDIQSLNIFLIKQISFPLYCICYPSQFLIANDTGSSRFKCKSSFSTESLRVMKKKLENLSWKIERNKEGFKSQLKSKQNFRTLQVRTSFPLFPNTCISDFTVNRVSIGQWEPYRFYGNYYFWKLDITFVADSELILHTLFCFSSKQFKDQEFGFNLLNKRV